MVFLLCIIMTKIGMDWNTDFEGSGEHARRGLRMSNKKLLMMQWWEFSSHVMVHGANNSEPCSLQRGSGMHVLGTKPFRMKNSHGALPWDGYEAMCLERKPQQRSQCAPHFMLQWSMEQNSADICLGGPSFTSRLQEWENSNALPRTEGRDGVSLSCEKRWSVHRQGTCASSQSMWFHYVSAPWKNISVSQHSLMLRWHQFWLHCETLTQHHLPVSLHFLWCCRVIYRQQNFKNKWKINWDW